MRKKLIGAGILMLAIFFIAMPIESFAANGSVEERKALLAELAIKHNVPPEIVIAIAYQETGMRQFDSNGNPILNTDGDGGIGIMQVTMSEAELEQKGIDEQKLKDDMAYNIEVGIGQLLEKRSWAGNLIPQIDNALEPIILESWYFPVLAYNGLEMRNDPARSQNTYQGRIFNAIGGIGLLPTNPPSQFDVTYNPNGNIMRFTEEQRHLTIHEKLLTESRQMYDAG